MSSPYGLSKEQRLKTKQYIEKDVPQGYVKVGFQKTSFKKYMGSDDVVNKFYQDNEFLIYDATEEFKNSGINLENYKDILEQWKKEVPIYEKKEKDDNNTVKIKNSGNTITNKTQNTTLFSVLNEILNFDTHNRDVEEYHKFICDVKNKILMTLMKVFQ